jgi:hypothetical protein
VGFEYKTAMIWEKDRDGHGYWFCNSAAVVEGRKQKVVFPCTARDDLE